MIIGGGTGGCSIAAKLSRQFDKNDCIVLEPSDEHYYQPMFTMIGGGMKTLADSVRSMKSVLPKNVKWMQDEAVNIQPKSNEVFTKLGHKIKYELLIISVGLQLHYNKV